jgi:hypothetical protein
VEKLGKADLFENYDHDYMDYLEDVCVPLISSMVEILKTQQEALDFYGDKDNWDLGHPSPTCWDDGDIDIGRRAEKALAKANEIADKALK